MTSDGGLCLHACAPQILLVMRQTDAAHTQALASKVSLLTLGQQAILDAHLCLVHLTTGAASFHPLCACHDGVTRLGSFACAQARLVSCLCRIMQGA